MVPTSSIATSPRAAAGQGGPRKRWRRLAWIAGAVLLGLVVIAAIVIATAPRWAAGSVERELEARLGKRLGLTVDIGTLELGWRTISAGSIALYGDDLDMEIDAVEATLDRGALWSLRVEVVEIEAIGGHLDADRAAVERLAERLRTLANDERDRDAGSWLRRHSKLTPRALELRRLSFAIDDGPRRVTGTLAATVDPAARRIDLRVSTMLAELGLGRPLRAVSIATVLEPPSDPQASDSALRFPLRVELVGVSAEVDENVAVAGVHGTLSIVDPEASELIVDLAGGFAQSEAVDREAAEGGDLWSISGRFARDLSAGKIAVDMQAFELGRVPQVLARLPLVESERATVGGHLELDIGEGLAKIDGQLAIAGVNVSHHLLAREIVRDVGFTVDIDAELDPRARRLSLERLALGRGGVQLLAHGEIVHAQVREQRRYQVTLDVPAVGCQEVLDAIPRELVPGLVDFELAGEFRAHVELDADFAKLEALRLDGAIELGRCVVRKAPRLASAERLNHGFTHRVTMRDGRTRTLRLFPGSSSYTPLANISRYMTEAVLTTEDGSFRRHDGFNTTQLQAALRRNLQAGKVRLGASTITMQMVKNVLLSHERTLSRKLQELFSTWWVEQALSKQRIMELYLNVIEFGPGIYGVTNAARHYFGKHPAELTSLEAAYLALMLPSPVRRHVHYCNGGLDPRYQAKLAWIHDLMLERGRITAEEHAVYSATPLVFDLLERGDPETCLAEIEALMAADQTQRALSGLLGDGDDGFGLEDVGWAGTITDDSGSWGVRPPLPDALPPPPAAGEVGEGGRLEPRGGSWMVPDRPIDDDPANADAPGRPAMDEVNE